MRDRSSTPNYSPSGLDRCPICGWRLADEEDHRAVPDPYGQYAYLCEHCAVCREIGASSHA